MKHAHTAVTVATVLLAGGCEILLVDESVKLRRTDASSPVSMDGGTPPREDGGLADAARSLDATPTRGDGGEGLDAAIGDGGGAECGSLTLCDGACVDTSSDDAHCGGCNDACLGGSCVGGACVPDCDYGRCVDECVSRFHHEHCGWQSDGPCGGQVCADSYRCDGTRCVPGAPSLRPDALVGAYVAGSPWGYVCPTQITAEAATVACRELGLELDSLFVAPASFDWDPVLFDFGPPHVVDCVGDEGSLSACDEMRYLPCDAEVLGSEPSYLVRRREP